MKSKQPTDDQDRDIRINKALYNMKHSDLQKTCVLKGLEFRFIVEWDHHKLSNWFYHNFELGENPVLLDEYDAWMNKQLEERGYKKGDSVFAPCFRLGFAPAIDEITHIKTPGVTTKVIPVSVTIKGEDKPKRSVDEATGVVSGTKKNLTFTLTKQGLDLPKIVEAVLKAFPDAQEKSIKIWYKRCLNGTK